MVPYLIGPILGASVITLAVLRNSGPGFFFFSIAVAGAFGVLVPLLVFTLRRSRFLSGKPGSALAIAIAIVVVLLLALSGTGLFNIC